MDEGKKDEIHQWLLIAQRDLGAACLLKESEAYFLDIVVYHCQQSSEKALKAYLTYYDVIFPKTHDLRVLLGLCISIELEFQQLQDIAENLTSYAVAYRYPGNNIEPEVQEAEQAIKMAEFLLKFVNSVLPPDISLI